MLKTAVNMILRKTGPVLAFTSARRIDGGTGAINVLLSNQSARFTKLFLSIFLRLGREPQLGAHRAEFALPDRRVLGTAEQRHEVRTRERACPQHRLARQIAGIRAPRRGRAQRRPTARQARRRAHAQRRRRVDQRTTREQLRGVPAGQPRERAVDDVTWKEPDLHLVEPDAEVATREQPVVAVDREHGATGRAMTRQREHHRYRAIRNGPLNAP